MTCKILDITELPQDLTFFLDIDFAVSKAILRRMCHLTLSGMENRVAQLRNIFHTSC